MGLWDFVRKMAQGKPVFEAPSQQQDDQAGWRDQPAQAFVNPTPFVNGQGRKIIPEIVLEYCKSHLNDRRMEVTAWATNRSQFEVELDAMVMLGAKERLDRRLRPQEGHEVTLYRGPQPADDHAHKANLYYKILQNGDNFQADFMIEYNLESSGLFTVEQLHPEPAVRDI